MVDSHVYSYQCLYDRPVKRRGRKVQTRAAQNHVDSPPRSSVSPPQSSPPHPTAAHYHHPHVVRAFDSLETTHYREAASTSAAPPPDGLEAPPPVLSSHEVFESSPAVHASPVLNRFRYACLEPLYPRLDGIVSPNTADDLIDHYFVHPNTSIFASASPFVLTPILRQRSLLRRRRPRKVSPPLVLTILWVAAHTAPLSPLLIPHERKRVCASLRDIVWDNVRNLVALDLSDRQFAGGGIRSSPSLPLHTSVSLPSQNVDQLLALLLVAIIVSAGDTKADTIPLYFHTIRLAQAMRLHCLDAEASTDLNGPNCSCVDSLYFTDCTGAGDDCICEFESMEEKRRVLWLLYSLDRHWALCYNSMPLLMDQDCQVYLPVAEEMWNMPNLDTRQLIKDRVYGPPLSLTGTDFFQYFLPLMTLLGDIIWTHHQQRHPRLHRSVDDGVVADTEFLLARCMEDIRNLDTSQQALQAQRNGTSVDADSSVDHELSPASSRTEWHYRSRAREPPQLQVSTTVRLYSVFIVHVLYVLLHGRWDAHDLLLSRETSFEGNSASSALSDWITSHHFTKCATHAIAASETLSQILLVDPELAFMPYLFGIYLLQGSFIFLFFADRMPDVGEAPNEAVEKACETIIHAHEVSFATLSTEFQRDFRKILRTVLYGVQIRRRTFHDFPEQRLEGSLAFYFDHHESSGYGRPSLGPDARSSPYDSDRARLKELLSLYRWTRGSHGLAV